MKKTMFLLFSYALNGGDGEQIGEIDASLLGKIFKISKKHDMAHLVGHAVKLSGKKIEGELAIAVEQSTGLAMFRYVKLTHELEAISGALDEAKIDFIPLKGSVMRRYYKEPWLRTSCDIDVLVKPEDVESAKTTLIEKLNYKYDSSWNYEHTLVSPSGINLELHHTLCDGSTAADKILSDVWNYARVASDGSSRYELSDGAFYLHHLAHMAKHFINGGCGIRPFMDIYVLKGSKFDMTDANELIKAAGLEKFREGVEALADVWFGRGEHTPFTLSLENFILNGGTYGNMENRVAVQKTKKGSRVSYIFSRIFLPYSELKLVYPNLERRKWLFPFYQIKRWFRLLKKSNRERSVKELKATTAMDEEQSRSAITLLEQLGL